MTEYVNNDLVGDIEKIKEIRDGLVEIGEIICISRAKDVNLDYQYAIDVEDFSYFYFNEGERDEDYNALIKEVKNETI